MSTKDTSQRLERLAALERRVKALESVLMAERKKTAALEQLLAARQQGLDQVLTGYEKAFDQAAKSYEPIIKRALMLSPAWPPEERLPKAVEPIQVEPENPSSWGNVASIFKDMPRTLAALALIISLFTGGTSAVSLFQSNLAQNQVETVSDQIQKVEEEAETAQQEASDAKLEAVMAKKDAEAAKEDAVEAKQDAEAAKEDADEAKQEAEQAKLEAEKAQDSSQ